MEKCKTCEYEKICEMPDFVRNDLKLCKTYTTKIKKTNADRIRAMSDEELAKFIRAVECCSYYGGDCGFPFCPSMEGNLCNGIKENTSKGIVQWLQSEVKGSDV